MSAVSLSTQVKAAGPVVSSSIRVSKTLRGCQPVVSTSSSRQASRKAMNTPSSPSAHSRGPSRRAGAGGSMARASTAHSPGQVRYMKVAESPSSVERRMNR